MTDLTEKTTALDEQSAVENSEESNDKRLLVWKEIFIQGVWKNNSTLVQLLGLCPLLAVSSTATNALRFRACNHVGFNLHQYSCFAFS